MADETQPKPQPSVPPPAQPVQVAAGTESGVQAGGLDYTENSDGTRSYPSQKPVKTEDKPA